MKNAFKRGFTLVELLVVVLIIGILSSVALPQYQKAVNKSRVAGYWPVLQNLAEAAKVCKWEKGSYCALDELDIEAPSCKPLPGSAGCSYYLVEMNGERCPELHFDFTDGKVLVLGFDRKGRFCGSPDMCAKYGITGTSSGTYIYLDSTSR